jgi:uncharacterized membrane protein (DUF2068 family)
MHADPSTYDVDLGKPWIMFAGVMLAVVGVLNLIYGIGMISDSSFFVGEHKFVLANLNFWGWVLTLLGAAQLLTSIGVFMTKEWARWLGILFAAANMIANFLAIDSYPILAMILFFVDVIIIWGLFNYGGRDRYNLAG